MANRNRPDTTLALAASMLLHGGAVAVALVAWPWQREVPVGGVVAVNIVSNAPVTDMRPAIAAEDPQEAQTEDPVEGAPVTTAGTPSEEPPAVATKSSAAAKAIPDKSKTPDKAPPKEAPKTPAKANRGLDLDALAASITKTNRPSGSPKAGGTKGPARPETAKDARPALGQGLSASALVGLTDELQRRWNPNCEVEGGRDVRIRVAFVLGPAGQVVGQVDAGGQEFSGNPVVQAAAERAIRSVYAAAPFRNLPREYYGVRIGVNFNAREACL